MHTSRACRSFASSENGGTRDPVVPIEHRQRANALDAPERVRVRDDPPVRGEPSDGQSLDCEPGSLDIPSARVSWLSYGKGYFDLRTPKSERSGPQVLDTEGWPVHLTLFGGRFGMSQLSQVEGYGTPSGTYKFRKHGTFGSR